MIIIPTLFIACKMAQMLNRFLKNAYIFSFLLLIIFLLMVKSDIVRRQNAKFGETVFSPSQEYRIDQYFISSGEPMVLLFRVYDKDHHLIAEHTRNAWPGAATERWTCKDGKCTEYFFEIGDADPITLPPGWLDRMRAKLP